MSSDDLVFLSASCRGMVFSVGSMYCVRDDGCVLTDDIFVLDKFPVRVISNAQGRVLASNIAPIVSESPNSSVTPWNYFDVGDVSHTVLHVPIEELPFYINYKYLSPLFHEILTTLQIPQLEV